MTPDEVRTDNQYALLLYAVSGVQDLKYDILHHPNVRETTDGGTGVCTVKTSALRYAFVFDPMQVKQAQRSSLNYTTLSFSKRSQEIKKRRKRNEEHQS